ncbi:TonB-dependent receptor [Pedobacter sp. B4-66]|uniref:SusC/RagA family TonB-linked outer membrane protein n=1 Tax=Pedobacter sp. B4-66 TaxID=2817280 RepID=UPI001BDA4620|nr:TonB-dependent receptor [Pedobacter sp. B4-66]
MKSKFLLFSLLITFLLSIEGYAQTGVKVNGKVSDAKGEGIPGVNIKVKGGKTGALTDGSGSYTITVPNAQSVLQFSFIGFDPQEFTVGTKSEINVTLKETQNELDQVVVVGYGTSKKKDLTGSISSISKENLNLGGVTANVAQAIQGRASGVQVTQASSAPGGNTIIRIRGGNSIKSTNEPLYVVDGFITDIGQTISPSDIEDIQILKDASATAIYGARGANGVILITTKRGKAGKSVVEFESYYGTQRIKSKPDLMNATDYKAIANAKAIEQGNPPEYTAADLASTTNTDWFDLATRNASVQSHNLNISGGNEDTRISISGNYFGQIGALKKTDFDRYSGRFNIDHKVSKRFTVGANAYAARSFSQYKTYDGNIVPSNVLYGIMFTSPAIAPYNADGTYARRNGKDNPLAWLLEPTNDRYNNRITANIFGDLQIIDDLTLHVSGGTEFSATKEGTYLPMTLVSGEKVKGQASVNELNTTRNLFETYLTYKKVFNDVHSFTAVGGFSYQFDQNERHFTQVQKFTTDKYLYNNLAGGAERIGAISYKGEDIRYAYFGRLNYAFKGKYLATFTFRNDVSSIFSSKKRLGYFPSGSLAWRVSDEAFMKDNKIFSNLKVRAGYGETGNDRVPPYTYMATYAPNGVSLGEGSDFYGALVANRLPYENLLWETNSQFDAGVDMGFLKDRLTVTADYYRKRTRSLLLDMPTEQIYGFSTQLINGGTIQNQGIELSINSRNIETDNMTWSTTLNIAYNKQKAIDLNGRPYIISQTANPDGSVPAADFSKLEVGKELSQLYGYVYDGVVKTGETYTPQPLSKPGDPKYKDLDGDGLITSSDRQILGNAYPHYVMGFNNSFTYKGFELGVFFQGAFGADLYNMNRLLLETYTGTAALQRWTPQNNNTDVPRNGYFTSKYGGYINSRFVEDASYVKLKNLSLGYNIPTSKIGFLKGVSNAKIYFTAQDLFTITKYTGSDPEVSSNNNGSDPTSANLRAGLDFNAYPAYRSFTLGLKLNF